MLTVTQLGNAPLGQTDNRLASLWSTPPTDADVRACARQTGIPEDVCHQLLYVECSKLGEFTTGGMTVPICYSFIRPLLVGLAQEGCEEYVESETGINSLPSSLQDKISGITIRPICSLIARKFIAAMEAYFSWGGPTWSGFPLVEEEEGPLCRRCASPNDLMPGEHFVPAEWKHPSQCRLNVAILTKDNRRTIVYLPCAHFHPTYYKDLGPRDRQPMVCRDRDGVKRSLGSKLPRYAPGYFSKRLKDWWPQQFEDTPWRSPKETLTSLISHRPVFQSMTPAAAAPAAAPVDRAYPAGTVAALDPATRMWRIAVPKSSMIHGADVPWYRSLSTWLLAATALMTATAGVVYVRKKRGS